MKITEVAIDSIHPYENNPRLNDKTVKKVIKSITEYGWQQPIVVDNDNVIIVGHTRWKAAKQMKLKTVPVLRALMLTPQQVKAYRLADNRIAQDSNWNQEMLKMEFKGINELDPHFDFDLTGFESLEVDELLTKEENNEEFDDTENIGELNEENITTQPGDLWYLGNHRVLCGDATNLDDMYKLNNNSRMPDPDMLFTDPPYGVNYKGSIRKVRDHIENDNLSDEDFASFLTKTFTNCHSILDKNASIYICYSDAKHYLFKTALEKAGFEVRNQIIWAKNHFVINFGRYNPQHEMIFYGHLRDEKDNWYGDNSQSTLWQFPKPKASDLHPTMKPIPLIEKAILNSSKRNHLILDIFGGSGSTLIAAEKTNRMCHMLEINPMYVDIIIKRWEDLTGQDAICGVNDKTFKQIKEERRNV